jgi:hypothetical protein
MGGLPQAQYSVHSSANPSASGIKYDPLRYGLKPGKYRVKHFGHSAQWRTREAMTCVSELLRGLFPPALAVKQSGSRRYSRDPCCPAHVVPHNLRSCAGLAPSRSIWLECIVRKMVRKLRKYPFYCSKRPTSNLRKVWLQTFAGKLDFGCVRATSAIDVPMLASTGVAR